MLGPLEVRRNGRLLSVPGGKTSELLVRLALDAGELVRTDRLLDDLWAAGGVTTRRNTLQSKVAKLRRALGDPPVIVSGDGGYALDVEPADVDALAVLAHTAAAAQLVDDGDDRAAADLCASTLTLFRGDVLHAAGDGDWVEAPRARLESARVTLVETQFSARLRLGDAGDLIGELDAAVRSSPFQEDLWALLITAQYRAGRQADALASYQRVRRQLADELGLEPGRQLQDLEQKILTQDASLGVPGVRSTAAILGNLPSLTPDLVGRESEIADLCERIATKRLVEIVGPGGIGKTAVAVEVGRRLATADGAGAGGVWLARLETAVTADDVVDTLIAALGVPGGEAAMFERLKSAAGLVILDNCEHVLDAAAALVVQLLDAAPDLRVLCTTQVPLDIDGEVQVDLTPLPLADAVELFDQRAAAQRPGHGTGGEEAVEDLCRSLDGLPLAIELAAARTRTLSVEEIIRRLDDRFPVLSDPTSRRPERRRALKATIRWSYELLFPDDQRGLWALATFAGGAPLAAVEYVLAALDVPVAAAMDVVGRLASRSLVIVDDDPASRSVRYRLLDSIRAYALEAMAEEGMAEPAVAAHAAWFETAAASSTEGVRSRHQAEHLAFARAERANIDAALSWSADREPLVGLHLVNGFGWAWIVLGDSRGAQRSLTALAAAGESAPTPDRADALLLAAWIEASTGHLALAREHIAAATELADGLDDVERQARCAYYLAYVVSHDGEFRQALELTDHSRALLDQLNRPWEQAANALFAARAAISAGEQERSVEAADQVEHWLGLVEDPWLRVRGRRCWVSWLGSSTASTTPSSTSGRPRRPRVASASNRPRRTKWPASVERSARPGITRRERTLLPWRSTRPKPRVTSAWRPSPESTSAEFSGRSASPSGLGACWRPPRHGTARRAAANRRRWATAYWLPSTPRTAWPAPRIASPVSSTTRCSPMMRPSRSSPVMRWPASPSTPVTSSGRGSSRPRPIAVWRRPPTSSPSAIGPTPRRSGDRRFGPFQHPLSPLVQHQEG